MDCTDYAPHVFRSFLLLLPMQQMDKRSKLPQDLTCFLHLCMTLCKKIQICQPFNCIFFVTTHRSNFNGYVATGMNLIVLTEMLYFLYRYYVVESRMLEEGMKKPPWRPLHLMGVSTCLIGTHMFTHFPHNLQKYTGKNTQNIQINKEK